MHVIVLRGPAGAGKSTLALAVQRALGYPTAHLDTDVLNWQFVPGEPNKYVVFNVLQQITSTYLAHGYHVVIAGTSRLAKRQGRSLPSRPRPPSTVTATASSSATHR